MNVAWLVDGLLLHGFVLYVCCVKDVGLDYCRMMQCQKMLGYICLTTSRQLLK